MKACEIIENAIENFKDIDKFGFVGLYGSKNPKHDYDLLFIRAPEVPRAEHVIGNMDLVNDLTGILSKEGMPTAVFPKEAVQYEIDYISPDSLKIHNVNFFDAPSLIKLSPRNYLDSITKNMSVFHGTMDILKNPDLQKENRANDPLLQLMGLNTVQGSVPEDYRNGKTKFSLYQIMKNNYHDRNYVRKIDDGLWDEARCLSELKKAVHIIEKCEA